jgi:23S rRNA maturation-related 3'-5' exoribonuclease YhaM
MTGEPVTDALRDTIRAEIPEIAEISDAELRDKVVEAWALAISQTSYSCISDIEGSAAPGKRVLKNGSQADHISGVARMTLIMGDEFVRQFPDLPVNRDILLAGAICHDVGKPFEYDHQKHWEENRVKTGWPPIRHPAYGAHICLTVGLPMAVAHMAMAHSREGEPLVRSVECRILYYADHSYWRVLNGGGVLADADPGAPAGPTN